MHARFAISALALAVSVSAQAASFSNTYFFGDSLSDSGAYLGLNYDVPGVGPVPITGGRFTTNPGQVWSELLASAYGQEARANNPNNGTLVDPQTGTNYSQGGARVNATPGFGGTGSPALGAQSVQQQIDNFIGDHGTADPHALYSVWAGANDIFAATANPATAGGVVSMAAMDLVARLVALKDAGARYVIVPNLPNIGDTPAGATAVASLNTLSSVFNSTLASTLQYELHSDANHVGRLEGMSIIALNINGLTREVLADPARYGFTNTTVPVCLESLLCAPADLAVANTSFFADGVHPTAAAHAIIAQYAQAVIDAPQQMAQLPNVALQNARSQRDTLANRFQMLRSSASKSAKLELYADVAYARADQNGIEGSAATEGDNRLLTVGGERRLLENLHLGFALSTTAGKHDFAAGKGSFDLNEVAFSLYGGVVDGGFHSQAYAQMAAQSFDNVTRAVQLGGSTRLETADARGHRLGAGLEAGYDLQLGPLRTGPLLGLHYQKMTVGSFHEKATDSVAMSFEKQNVSSLLGRLGWTLAMDQVTNDVSWTPFAELIWENEFKNDAREVEGGLTSTGTTFAMPVTAMDGNHVNYRLGVSAALKGWKGLLSYSGFSGLEQGSFRSLNLNVSRSF